MRANYTLQMQHGYKRTARGRRATNWRLLKVMNKDLTVHDLGRLSERQAEALKPYLPYGD